MSPDAAEMFTWTTSAEVKMAWQEVSETPVRASGDRPGGEGQAKA
jgi:hypothetical protein